MFRIGVISDTHGFLDPEIPTLFAGVNHILHTGDVGPRSLLRELEALAPTTAVLGNTDGAIGLRLTELAELAGRKFLLHHIVNPHQPGRDLLATIENARPDAVVFGHTHRPFCQTLGGVLYFNPGYAGHSRFGQPRSVAILECDDHGLRPQQFPLWD